MVRTIYAGALVSLLAAVPARATPPTLGLPLACVMGESCWVIQYVDHDPGEGRRDYMCGWLSYDKHNGTDFMVANLKAMAMGVPVAAAAPGTVHALRDGMDDVDANRLAKDTLTGRECGNGVSIDHGDGWISQYCHLRRGSIAVVRGQRVDAGQMLGLVGLSGQTEFPHVDISVRHNGKVVDPFLGEESGTDAVQGEKCGLGAAPLWRPDVLELLAYRAAILPNAGFAVGVPELDAVRDGTLDVPWLAADAPALVLWSEVYWARPDDVLALRIFGPDSRQVFEQKITVEKRVARDLYYAGLKRRAAAWPPGTYRGEIELTRAAGPIGPETYTISRSVILR